ncbi:MAG: hypothetical protein ACLSB9_18910 [Hydrogeniiclostridium mannosilyticum]
MHWRRRFLNRNYQAVFRAVLRKRIARKHGAWSTAVSGIAEFEDENMASGANHQWFCRKRTIWRDVSPGFQGLRHTLVASRPWAQPFSDGSPFQDMQESIRLWAAYKDFTRIWNYLYGTVYRFVTTVF